MRTRDDEGSALLMVLGMMMVLTIIVTAAGTLAMRTAAFSRHSTDWNAALAAAEAGVDDYLARLNRNDNYWVTSPDCTNLAMRKPNVSRCSWTSSTTVGWASVPGSDRAQFHYDVVTDSTPVNGTVKLTSTGRLGSVKRTVSTVLRRGGFGEFLYYTVYETIDPANEAVFGLNNEDAQDKCAHYAWEPTVAGVSKPRDQDDCYNIDFISADRINGPLHSNDTMVMKGSPKFQGTVTTSDPACKPENRPVTACYDVDGSASPQFDKGIAYRAEVPLPTSIADLKRNVDPARTSTPGCLYTGPTRIKLNPNPTGTYSTMTVWSPWSKTALNPGCGNYQQTWPQTVALPNNNIVMVRDVPSTQSSPSSSACASGTIGGFPQSDDVNQSLAEASCRYGTLYLEGNLHGRVTFAADNNIVITGDTTYVDGKTGLDAMGLIATNSVKIYHPVKCTGTSDGVCSSGTNLSRPSGGVFQDPTVHASILTLQHSFTVQSYNLGSPLGGLHLFGSFAQRFRGPVGTSNSSGGVASGYAKDYEYDTRLRYSPPPFFLDPVSSSWGVKAYGESTPAY
jgi:Tfp pilus assembly protein PilX